MRTVTPAQFTRQMRAMPATLQSSTRRGVEKAAMEVTTAVRRNIAAVTHGTSRLSRVGKHGARVGARYKVNQSAENPSALITAEGPLQLIERDTSAHQEIPRSVGRLTRDSRGVLSRTKAARHEAKQRFYTAIFGGEGGYAGAHPLHTPYGPRFKVDHPGTHGKHPFERGVNEVEPRVPRIVQGQIHDGLSRIFR